MIIAAHMYQQVRLNCTVAVLRIITGTDYLRMSLVIATCIVGDMGDMGWWLDGHGSMDMGFATKCRKPIPRQQQYE